MLNWLKKKLGYHVCEEWTQWETHEIQCVVVPYVGGLPIQTMEYTVTRRYQERRCTICERRQLNLPAY